MGCIFNAHMANTAKICNSFVSIVKRDIHIFDDKEIINGTKDTTTKRHLSLFHYPLKLIDSLAEMNFHLEIHVGFLLCLFPMI